MTIEIDGERRNPLSVLQDSLSGFYRNALLFRPDTPPINDRLTESLLPVSRRSPGRWSGRCLQISDSHPVCLQYSDRSAWCVSEEQETTLPLQRRVLAVPC